MRLNLSFFRDIFYGQFSFSKNEEIEKLILEKESELQVIHQENQDLKKEIELLKNNDDHIKKIKVVIDCGNGAAGCIAPELFKSLGCEVIELYSEVDGNFPNHHPDPGKTENLKDLIQEIKKSNADLGLAFDGDGDRVGLVTNEGEIIFPDKILMMFSQDILSSQKGSIIFDVKCSNALPKIIKDLGGNPIMSPTGHFHIKNGIKN